MRPCLLLSPCLFLLAAQAQSPEELSSLAAGRRYLPTPVFSAREDAAVLDAFAGLRVADVSDGMDMAGLPGTGLVDPAIHPDWIDLEGLTHQFRGIAVTVRYVPTQRPDRPAPGEKFPAWEGRFYSQFSHEEFASILRPGSAVVIDDVEEKDIGSIGSFNILAWQRAGATGVVTDAAARDTDEVAVQKVPLYLRHKGRGIRPGRNEIESVNLPVVIGGVLVCPGDVVVADGDGVIIVPRGVALQVAGYARTILNKDKGARRGLYQNLGLPLDSTVDTSLIPALHALPQTADWSTSWWLDRHFAHLDRDRSQPVDLLWLGDSITDAWDEAGLPVWQEFYASRRALNLGLAGDRTEQILWRLRRGEVDGLAPRLTVLLIGTNNTGHRMDPAAETVAGIRAILQELRTRLPASPILLLSIFPRGASPDDPARLRNAEINRALPSLADGRSIHFLDLHDRFLQPDGTLSPDIMPDFLHPNERGYRLWAEALEPSLASFLGPRP